LLVFLALFALAFAIKVPVDALPHLAARLAHAEAQTTAWLASILAGVLLKLGAYGSAALLASPMLPDATALGGRAWIIGLGAWRASSAGRVQWPSSRWPGATSSA
jgi:NADH:ubiquinone oxidoreductase subunit 4 (subunit M)